MNILLVEDNPADARLVREALAESGSAAPLHWVSNAEDAMACLRQAAQVAGAGRPDLVLLDLNLPGIHGLELLREIKSDPALRAIPVVVLSSSAARQDVYDAYAAQANSYVVKPVDFDQFVAAVATIRHYWADTVLLPTRVG